MEHSPTPSSSLSEVKVEDSYWNNDSVIGAHIAAQPGSAMPAAGLRSQSQPAHERLIMSCK